jgi:bifunctional DNase/RNase
VRPVDLVGLQLEPQSGVSLVVLREHEAPNRILPIFIGGPEAASIAIALSGEAPPRPLVHDVMATMVSALTATVESVEVTDVRDGTFIARITLGGPGGQQHIDSRPSDAIALAVRTGANLFVADAVLDEAGALVAQLPDEEAIDDAVEQFRHFLDELNPADFAERTAEPTQPGLGAPDAAEDEGPPEPGAGGGRPEEAIEDQPGTGTGGAPAEEP